MRQLLFVAALVLNFILSPLNSARAEEEAAAEETPRFVVHLLDYLAKDYGGAVSNAGQILSQSEYDEQVEFAQSAVKTAAVLPVLKRSQSLQDKLARLLEEIQAKASPQLVTPLARELQMEVISLSDIKLQPFHWPSLEAGQRLYAANCIVCHGSAGRGDGELAEGLDPRPANFTDQNGMQALTPFAAFNTIRLGVPGTGMAPFAQLSDQEAWELAFYVNSLRFSQNRKAKEIPAEWSPDDDEVLKKVASLSDAEIKRQIGGNDLAQSEVLAALRLHEGVKDQGSFFTLASVKLKESGDHYNAGEFEQAKTKALQAYLEGIEPVEAKLRAAEPQAVVEIEEAMGRVRSAIESRKSGEEVALSIVQADRKITELRPLVEDHEMSPAMAFLSSFVIILREGFEAVLVILALLGVTRATRSKKASAYVHAGWLTAIFVGIVAWIFSGWLMAISGASREKLEGVTAIFAVLVLLYVGFWLHRQTEIGRWKTFLEVRVKHFLSGGNLLGLAAISFVAAFREVIETVLFLRVVWIDLDQGARMSMALGVVSSLGLVIVLSWIALRYSRRLPLKALFNFSSLMMLGLATILAGKGVHALQEAGTFGVDAFPIRIRLDLLGLYPTMQTVFAQILTAAVVMGLWFYGRQPSYRPAESAER